eukprot:2624819-Rhodomonas_salina.1
MERQEERSAREEGRKGRKGRKKGQRGRRGKEGRRRRWEECRLGERGSSQAGGKRGMIKNAKRCQR